MKASPHLLLPAVAALVLCSGCAMIMNGFSSSGMDVRSTPPGAVVYLDGDPVGKTPIRLRPDRRGIHEVKMELPGVPGASTNVVLSTNPWTWVNCCWLIDAPFYLAIDYFSGNYYRYRPREWEVVFPEAAESASPGGADDPPAAPDAEMRPAAPPPEDAESGAIPEVGADGGGVSVLPALAPSAGSNPELDAMLDKLSNEN